MKSIKHYTDKTLIVLSATSGGISTIFFTNVIAIPAGVISASLALVLSLTTGIIKKLLKETKKRIKHIVKLLGLLRVN